jgi:hypothetical protein
MADIISEEVKLIREMIRNTEAKFVVLSSSERTSLLYNRNTGALQTPSATVNADSLQAFRVSDGKTKLLFKVES